ncbi:sigma-70 family RNA polymerase sigma factor [Wolinella succinogenes]|uniref:PUTATIVE RNA POLYMERASE SIGMA FACTOR n=1 Tax=Wolinella succinogenes (strain ATCC 29543 / DSM 1740 / CCUG 13145 / JCM 31913 / LMG 7466 / NCTC 11488 / FDC 602W) TaxID=273121 RepID=Q7M8T6_WOLSU|nr:sigma-70 family RNA polymerase sigma factor [Wolinella succinogenes]NLU33812.1 sigma-70 family RNA polymerase sigma factor [Wolinella succinogenes]CAE10485.1 PUTATIVE RNA POLYMERASE SIGMA FACTOR [Wolinella succinogenes]VEG80629.1 Probable RNA polymerase sigma factor fecI [Wolinella succinogenes]HCZ19676.1 RNA polymerase subunit sigma [Helicobacter sp.]
MLEAYYRELLGYFQKSLGDIHLASDVVQEAYARVLSLQAKEIPIAKPRALLYKTAKNIAVDEYRRNRRQENLLHEQARACVQEWQGEESFELQETLLRAIDSLPPRCKEAFVLHKLEGFSQAEVAEKMGISKNMVEKHIIKALLECERALEEAEKKR